MKLILLLCSLALAKAAVSDFNELLGVRDLCPADLAGTGGANGTQGALAALAQLISQPQAVLRVYQQFKTDLQLSSFIGAISSSIQDLIGRFVRQAQAPADDSWKQTTVPDAFDWRNQKIISPAKDQGQRGSCTTFTAAAILEASLTKAYYAKNNNVKTITYDLSEQELGDSKV